MKLFAPAPYIEILAKSVVKLSSVLAILRTVDVELTVRNDMLPSGVIRIRSVAAVVLKLLVVLNVKAYPKEEPSLKEETDPHRRFVKRTIDARPKKSDLVEEFKTFIEKAEQAL